jgi:NAD(P)-dependent dehydrogenase (short-subunit alcohol dehydrogenase family)
MGRLDQKIAVITGSATGIGQATALVFADQGATVVCADVSLDISRKTDINMDLSLIIRLDITWSYKRTTNNRTQKQAS